MGLFFLTNKIVIIILFIFYLISGFFVIDGVEISRVPSPNGKVDGVIIVTNGGATANFGYYIYIVPSNESYKKGKQVGYLYGAWNDNSKTDPVKLNWEGDLLQIGYSGALQSAIKAQTVSVAGINYSTQIPNRYNDLTISRTQVESVAFEELKNQFNNKQEIYSNYKIAKPAKFIVLQDQWEAVYVKNDSPDNLLTIFVNKNGLDINGIDQTGFWVWCDMQSSFDLSCE